MNYSLILITRFSSPLGMKLKLNIDSVASKDSTFFVLFCYDFNVHTIIHCLMNIKEKCLYKMPLASGMPFGGPSSHSLSFWFWSAPVSNNYHDNVFCIFSQTFFLLNSPEIYNNLPIQNLHGSNILFGICLFIFTFFAYGFVAFDFEGIILYFFRPLKFWRT